MSSFPLRHARPLPVRKLSTDPHNELNPHMDHYIGIDVGTGSARACVIDHTGDILGLATENIGLWQPQQGYYVRHRRARPVRDIALPRDMPPTQSYLDPNSTSLPNIPPFPRPPPTDINTP